MIGVGSENPTLSTHEVSKAFSNVTPFPVRKGYKV